MSKRPNFIQIHTLTPLNGVLVNRDESGHAKRINLGGRIRTRISSQCLKRSWRIHDGEFSLNKISPESRSLRSRIIIEEVLIPSLNGMFEEKTRETTADILRQLLHGGKRETSKIQIILMGEKEVAFAKGLTQKIADELKIFDEAAAEEEDKKEIQKLSKARGALVSRIVKENRENLQAFRSQTEMAAGMTAALHGRMMTADTRANIEAPVHVAHSFTVHSEETETDPFAAVDDLVGRSHVDSLEAEAGDDGARGSAHMNEVELTSNLFYGYVNIDINNLMENVGNNKEVAAQILHNMIYVVGEVMPSYKAGATAPHSRASFMMITAGNRQPMSLSEAFRVPTAPRLDAALDALQGHVNQIDNAYGMTDVRKYMSISNQPFEVKADRSNVPEMASWVSDLINETAQ